MFPTRAEQRSAVHDLGCLVRFRYAGLGRAPRRRLLVAVLGLLAVTAAVVLLPARLRGETGTTGSTDVLLLLPTGFLGFWLLNAFAVTANGGGREVVPRDQAVAFPVSSTTEHLGALVCAPLNIGWIVQAWLLLGATSYAFGPHRLPLVELPVLCWLGLATALAQLVGWLVEGVRRGPRGVLAVRLLGAALAAAVGTAVVTGTLGDALDRAPTRRILMISLAAADDRWSWLLGVAALLASTVGVVWLGALAARWALRRPEREELRAESGRRRPRPLPSHETAALLRLDRASVWRSVPLRRGLVVLTLTPGLVAAAGTLDWSMITVLPGLVASGAALLFAVNVWCLDGRGALWRQSLPLAARTQFWVRAAVVAEIMIGAAAVTVVLSGLRSGLPTPAQAAAAAAAVISVGAHVTAVAMGWSARRPYAADLRSARATPAPPVVMLGYSARLAATTTLIGMVFGGLAHLDAWWASGLLGLALVCLAARRLVRAADGWDDPSRRAAVVAAVAA